MIFEKFRTSKQREESSGTKVRVSEGYNVQRRTSARTHIDGTREKASSQVTHLSVSREPIDDETQATYEEVLDMRIRARQAGPLIEEKVRDAERSLMRAQRQQALRIDARSTGADPAHRRSPIVRPVSTISSSGAADFDACVVGAGPHLLQGDESASVAEALHDDSQLSMRQVGRKKSGGVSRPPPLKPNLHKTAAATGTSIGTVSRSPQLRHNSEFISITEQKPIQREVTDFKEKSATVTPAPSNPDATLIPVPESTKSNDVEESNSVQATATKSSRIEPTVQHDENDEGAKPNPDVKYAFNIPTAEIEAFGDSKRS